MTGPGASRRVVLLAPAAGALAAAGGAAAAPAAVAAGAASWTGGLEVLPRSAWGADLPARGPIPREPDVRLLLVHHTAQPANGYPAEDVPRLIRGIFRFHTSEKRWPDVAYNFLVDAYGRVWEGRSGSLTDDVPPAGDATGGNQGYSQLCCFLGDHQAAAPTDAAVEVMGRLLGALARRHGIDVRRGATTTFVSRGSNRHPVGTTVVTSTLAGHRDMSATGCPGDRAYALVRGRLREAAEYEARAGAAAGPPAASPGPGTAAPPGAASAPSAPAPSAPTTSPPPPAPPASGPPATQATAGAAAPATATPPATPPGPVPAEAGGPRTASPGPGSRRLPLLRFGSGAALAVATTAAGAVVALRRRTFRTPPR